VVAAFIATQAEDGYLGPFPNNIRLLKNWDLWVIIHAISALALWYQHTSDAAALNAARKAPIWSAGLISILARRVFDAGDPEMNMTILTGLAMAPSDHRRAALLANGPRSGKRLERAGDYLRAGLDGREYFQVSASRAGKACMICRPGGTLARHWRGEVSRGLHSSLAQHSPLGPPQHRRRSVSGEQATGNPYAPTAIETCCTVLDGLTADYLRADGRPGARRMTLNWPAQRRSGRAACQRPLVDLQYAHGRHSRSQRSHDCVSGPRWHAGTELLLVNGPRVIGMLSDWAVMSAKDGFR